MALRDDLICAAIGWLAGVGVALLVGFLIFPALIGNPPGAGADTALILGMVLLLTSPGALIGGFMGGRLLTEGGHGSQRMMAALLGICAAVPCSCIGFWVNGW